MDYSDLATARSAGPPSYLSRWRQRFIAVSAAAAMAATDDAAVGAVLTPAISRMRRPWPCRRRPARRGRYLFRRIGRPSWGGGAGIILRFRWRRRATEAVHRVPMDGQ